MRNPFCDKYFTKSRIIAEKMGIDPIVEYRVFTRFPGIAAFEPLATLFMQLAKGSEASIDVLETGTKFEARDTVAVYRGRFTDIVEHETQLLQWTALPAYCALEASKIVEAAGDKIVIDFHARHAFDPVSTALCSYGAQVGGIRGCSTDVGANALAFLKQQAIKYVTTIDDDGQNVFDRPGTGTTPHALLAIFKGDYCKMAEAYLDVFPNDKFVALIDYNNEEITDTLRVLELLGKHLAGVRIDTCGENSAQVGYDQSGMPIYDDGKGVTEMAMKALKNALRNNGGEHVKVFGSSGFGVEKTQRFMENCPSSIDGIGTGSFIPKFPTATADIFRVDGKVECKKGRGWGVKSAEEFYEKGYMRYEVAE